MSHIKAQVLDPKKADEAIDEVLELALANQVTIGLAGGLAMQLYGSDRFTRDVDFIASAELPLANPHPLSFGGVGGFASNGTPVDIIVRNDESASLYRAAELHLVQRSGLPVVSPEYLAAMKFDAGRPKDELDLAFLVLSGEVDLLDLRNIVREHMGRYAVKELASFIEEAQWRASREKP